MKRLLLALPFLGLLAACDVSRGGAGSLADGTPVTAKRTMTAYTETFTLTSAQGWSCTGTAQLGHGNTGAVHQVPLRCTDGATGTGTVTFGSPLRGQQGNLNAVLEFRLSDGRAGKVAV